MIIGSHHFVFEDEGSVIPEDGREQYESLPPEYSHLYMAVGGRLAAVICIIDPLREEAASVVSQLRALGLSKIVMMTGDSDRTAKAIAQKVGVDEYYSEVLPEDKASFVEAEIAVLRTHIVNYAKTRETYVAYRKAGYSRKFREEHEQEILLHQAAKNAFDEMGVKKLPKVKDLQSEYAKLLEEKKKTYAEYRRSREEMRELLTAKANVDRLLKMDEEQKKEQEKDHGQR